jgi:predicted amidohydrolase YtcJ
VKLAASLGLTSIQNASGSPEEWSLYEELLSRGELTLRVSMAFSVGPNLTQERLDQFIALREKRRADPMLRAGAAKILIDGVIESHTAAMLEPYSDKTDTRGEAAHSAEQYNNLVERLDRAGFQIYTHAIGDRGVRMALDAYERAQRINQRLNPRHRIEHIEVISRQDVPRFAALGVMASMEPIHADPDTVEVWARAVGPERLRRAFAWGDLARSGAALVYSSDWPASISLDPIRGLHNAVNRRTTDGKPKAGWIPEQRVSLQQALRAYTATGAYASFEEAIKGKLAPGLLADVIVFSEDLFRIEPIRIHETRVVLTVFDGRVIYRDHQRFPQ